MSTRPEVPGWPYFRAAAVGGAALWFAAAASAIDLRAFPDGSASLALHPTLKLSALGTRNPEDPILFPAERRLTGFGRLRLDLEGHWQDTATVRTAYEQYGRWTSRDETRAGAPGQPGGDRTFFRLAPLAEKLTTRDRVDAYHELDRALVAFHPSWGEVTVGRQAVGLGRGQLFSAVDLFAPFSPLDVDREWRRGIDAVRIEWRATDTTSIELIGVGAERWEDCAWVLRARGYLGDVDAEALLGSRGEDEFAGAVLSAAVADAEVHLEGAVFRTPEEHPDGQVWGSSDIVPVAVAGASYTFGVGAGLTIVGEYYYSGFGARDIREATTQFMQPEYATRLARGDTQTIGRHAMGLAASCPLTESLGATLSGLISPADGSGTLFPSLRWDLSQSLSLLLTAYLPWGDDSKDGRMRSEYGAAPHSIFAQLALYF